MGHMSNYYFKKIVCTNVSGRDPVCSVFTWSAAGDILDADGLVVRNVWKTWSWSTALAELEAGQAVLETHHLTLLCVCV